MAALPERLTEAGIALTYLERRLLENDHFRFFHENGGLQVAERTLSAIDVEGGGLEPWGEKTSPSAVGRLCDERFRPLLVLAATISRDADPTVGRDRQLVADLYRWLAGNSTQSFFWDRELARLNDMQRKDAAAMMIAADKQGDSDVLLLIANRLTSAEIAFVRLQLDQYLVDRQIFFPGDRSAESTLATKRNFPRTKCLFCEGPGSEMGGPLAAHGRGCIGAKMFVLLDCGKTQEILARIPPRISKLLRKVRFRIPKSSFRELTYEGMIAPQLLIFILDQLTLEEQVKIYETLHKWLRREQAEYLWRDLYADSVVVKPANSRSMTAVMVSGMAAGDDVGTDKWGKDLLSDEEIKRIFTDRRITINLVEANR